MKIFSLLCLLLFTGLSLARPPVVHAPDTTDGGRQCCDESAAPALANVHLPRPPSAGDVTGKATGRVVLDGELPKPQELSITEAAAKGCTDDGSKVMAKNHALLVGEDKGIANAVVTISVPDQKIAVPEKPILLDQAQCRFSQHVVVVPVGATLEYKNSDSVPHNVHTYALKNKAFNRTLAGNSSYKQVVEKAETIQVKCDIHPWMSSFVFVTDTNYATLTDEHGAFELPGLAPGEYTAKIWHEKLGKAEAKIVIDESGESQPVSVPMKLKKKRRRSRR